jgi:hypothetical protein
MYLDQARRAEERALAVADEREQDALLDSTVLLRILANLPSLNKARPSRH